MSFRDKKLLVYLGALLILAAAYFLVGRPFLDKIDNLDAENSQLNVELKQKQQALERQDEFRAGIEEKKAEMQKIIDKFPEDNSDEKSIMFIHKAETDIPIWVSKIKFAEETQNLVSGSEEESASDVEQEQLEENVAAAEGEEAASDQETGGGGRPSEGYSSVLGELKYRDTDIGIEVVSQYEEFKKFLEHIRDYEDRLVINEIEMSYDNTAGLVHSTITLSQYALLGPGRELPKVESGIDNLGTGNVFVAPDHGGSFLDMLADAVADLYNRIRGGLSTEAAELAPDYFMRVTAVTDNTNGIVVGRADDVQQKTYITSDEKGEQDVSISISGSDGSYTVKYSVGDNGFEDSLQKSTDQNLYFRIASTERMSDSDKVSARVHVINNSDIPVIVNVEGDDESRPRIDIVEKDGDVTVR